MAEREFAGRREPVVDPAACQPGGLLRREAVVEEVARFAPSVRSF